MVRPIMAMAILIIIGIEAEIVGERGVRIHAPTVIIVVDREKDILMDLLLLLQMPMLLLMVGLGRIHRIEIEIEIETEIEIEIEIETETAVVIIPWHPGMLLLLITGDTIDQDHLLHIEIIITIMQLLIIITIEKGIEIHVPGEGSPIHFSLIPMGPCCANIFGSRNTKQTHTPTLTTMIIMTNMTTTTITTHIRVLLHPLPKTRIPSHPYQILSMPINNLTPT